MHLGGQPTGHGCGDQQCIRLVAVGDEAQDLVTEAAQPPQQAPQVVHDGRRFALRAAVAEGRRKTGQRQQQATHEGRVGDGGGIQVPVVRAHDEAERGPQGQHCPGDLWQPALLAQAQPGQRGTFQCEHTGGGACRQRQRHRQRGEADCEYRVRLAERSVALTLDQRPRQACIQRSQCQRAQRQQQAVVMQQAGLQREGDQRRAEHQAAIDQVALFRTLPARIQDRDQQIEGEEQQQERLGAGELVRAVLEHAPGRPDAEGEGETEQVQGAPRAPPGNRQDRCIEHGVIREQRDMVAAAGGQPDRRHEAGQDAEDGQRARVLHHRQHAHAGDQQHAEHESGRGRHQVIAFERGENGQQQDADRPALQCQREHAPGIALHPAEHQPGQRRHGDGGQAQLDRCIQPALVAGVLE